MKNSAKQLSRQFAFGKNLWSYNFEKSNSNLYFFKGPHGKKRKRLKSIWKKTAKINKNLTNQNNVIKLLKKAKLHEKKSKKVVLYWGPKNKTQSLFYSNNLTERLKLRKYYGNFNENQFKNLYKY